MDDGSLTAAYSDRSHIFHRIWALSLRNRCKHLRQQQQQRQHLSCHGSVCAYLSGSLTDRLTGWLASWLTASYTKCACRAVWQHTDYFRHLHADGGLRGTLEGDTTHGVKLSWILMRQRRSLCVALQQLLLPYKWAMPQLTATLESTCWLYDGNARSGHREEGVALGQR